MSDKPVFGPVLPPQEPAVSIQEVSPGKEKKPKDKPKEKRTRSALVGRSLLKKGVTGWEVEKKDLPPNDAERRLYDESLPLKLRFFNAVKSFRSFRRFVRLNCGLPCLRLDRAQSPLKAKIFTEYLHFGGIYMKALSRRYGETWRDFEEEQADPSQPAKPKDRIFKKGKFGAEIPAPHPSEDKLLRALEDQYKLVPDIEGVARAFLSDWLMEKGHDRNLVYLETAALVVFTFLKFMVQREAIPEYHVEVLRAFDVSMAALKGLPASYNLPNFLPSRLDRAVTLTLKRDGYIKALDLSATLAEPKQTVPHRAGWGAPTEEEHKAAIELIHADLPPPTASGWKIGRRSRFTARRILEVVAPEQKSLFDLEIVHPSIRLSTHTEREGTSYTPEGYLGPLEIRISAHALPHSHQDLVLEADYVELISEDCDETQWILEQLWQIEQGFHLPCDDDFGQLEDVEPDNGSDGEDIDTEELDEVL